MKNKMDDIVMLWGHHQGKRVCDIPSSYLKYVAETWTEDTAYKKKLVKRCDEEWQYRERYNCHTEE